MVACTLSFPNLETAWELQVNKECKRLCTAVVREVMSAFLSINNRKIITKWKGVVKGAFSMQTIPGSDN